jgi:PhnB protein
MSVKAIPAGHHTVTPYLAVKNAAKALEFYKAAFGDRSGQLEDPFGHLWWVATHKEDVAPEEMHKRVEAMFAEKQ